MYPLIFSRLAVEVDFKTASAELHYHLSRSSTALKCKEIKDSKLSLKSIILINSNKHKELIEVGEGAHKRFEDICSVISFPAGASQKESTPADRTERGHLDFKDMHFL